MAATVRRKREARAMSDTGALYARCRMLVTRGELVQLFPRPFRGEDSEACHPELVEGWLAELGEGFAAGLAPLQLRLIA
jgi:hypothetical protein